MRAAVCRAFGKPLVIEDVTLAAPGPGEISVDLKACAICHSDIIFADGGWGGTLPAVYGHEAAGVVRTVGPGVTHLKPGDHVVATLIRSCGTCPSCRRGAQVTCESEFPIAGNSPLRCADGSGLHQGLNTGAFAEQIVVDASQAAKIPADMPFASASLLACGVITGFGAVVHTADLRPGASAVVIGVGGVGLNVVQGLAIAGADRIVALDLVEKKLEAARRFGATHAVRAGTKATLDEVRKVVGPRGAEYVFVAVGAKPALESAMAMAAPSGAVVIVGIPEYGVTLGVDPVTLASSNQRILGSKMGGARIREDIPRLVALYRDGRLKLDELVSGRFRLEDINAAIASTKGGGALRNVIVFD